MFDAFSQMREMTNTDLQDGSRVFLAVFAVTAPLAVWLCLAFLLDSVIEGWVPAVLRVPSEAVHVGLLAGLYVATMWCIRSVQHRHPRFLRTPPRYTFQDALLPIAVWGVAAYAAFGILLGVASYLLVNRRDDHWFFIVYAFALWVPVWLAIPVGALIAWRRESQ